MLNGKEDISPEASVKFLEEAARYFKKRDTGGEDSAYWANIANSESCQKIAKLIKEKCNA